MLTCISIKNILFSPKISINCMFAWMGGKGYSSRPLSCPSEVLACWAEPGRSSWSFWRPPRWASQPCASSARWTGCYNESGEVNDRNKLSCLTKTEISVSRVLSLKANAGDASRFECVDIRANETRERLTHNRQTHTQRCKEFMHMQTESENIKLLTDSPIHWRKGKETYLIFRTK